jgi:hypothetical protein
LKELIADIAAFRLEWALIDPFIKDLALIGTNRMAVPETNSKSTFLELEQAHKEWRIILDEADLWG